jgi:hypothetical protein
MNLVSLLILPAVITMQRHHNNAARFTIAGVSLVVLAIAIAFSKRAGTSLGADLPAAASVSAGE